MLHKRIIAFFISAVLILSVMPSIVMAEGSLNITYEMLTGQSGDCISENLTLPEEIDGAEVSWSSSDESVIKNDGTVIRGEGGAKEVTLTAEADGKQKTFDFTVMPENYYVNYSDNFAYLEYENRVVNDTLPDWDVRWGNTSYPSSKFRIDTFSDGTTNCYTWNELWKDRPIYNISGIKPDGKFYVSTDVYMDFEKGSTAMYDFEFDFGTGSNAWMRFYFLADGTVGEVRFYGGVSGGSSLGAHNTFGKYNLPGRWVNLKWEFDTDAQLMWLYIDGERVTKASGISSPFACAPLKSVIFNIGTNVVGHSLGIDNMSIVTKYDDVDEKEIVDAYSLLNHETFSSEATTAVTQNLDLTGRVEGYDDITYSFESGSSNLVINGSTGEIIRSEEDKEAVLYVNISKDSSDYVLQKKLTYNVKGTNYKVYTSSTFKYPDLVGQRPVATDGGWRLSQNPLAPGYLDAEYVHEDNNYAVKTFRTVSDSTGKTDSAMFYATKTTASKRDITLEMRLKMGKATGETQIYNLNLYGQYEGYKGNKTFSQMHLYVTKSSISMRASVYDELAGGNKSVAIASAIAVPMEWFDLKFVVDMFNKKFDVYINGRKRNAAPLSFAKESGIDYSVKATGYGYFSCNPYRGIKEAEVYIDDYAAYSVQGMKADVAVYNGEEKVSDLGYLNPGDTVSADVQLYNFESGVELDGASVIAGIYSGNNLYDVAVTSADCENGLLTINFPKLTIPETIENAGLRVFFMDKNNKLTPVREEYVFPHKLNGIAEKKEYVDPGTGRTYYTLDLNGEHAIRSYYTMSTWAKDSEKFYFYDNQYRMYEYDIETDKYKYIDSLFGQNLVMVSKLGNVFYIRKNKEIVRMAPDYSKEVVGTLPLNMNIGAAGLLQVNDNESYLSVEITENNSTEFDVSKKKRIPVMDVETGEWDLRYIYGFDTKVYAPDHMNLNPNPEYSNLVAFAHEGTGDNGEGNPERIWLLDRDTGEAINVFKQKMSYGRVPAETVSHEAWMQSGELMMFANSSKTTPGGITLFKKDGSDRRYVNNDYNYLHSAGSTVTDRFVVSDTGYNGSVTQLVLIDCYTGNSYLLATLPQNGKDPGHAHPCFSFDGMKVIFGLYAEDLKTIRIGWMDVSDIIVGAEDGEEIILSDSCKTSSYEKTNFALERKKINGKEFFNIAEGNHMNVNITAFEEETVDVEITFDYLDKGTDNIDIDYIRWESVNGKNKIVNYKQTVAREDSGEVKTAKITLAGINAENLKILATDFTIKGAKTDLAIRNVSVKKINLN